MDGIEQARLTAEIPLFNASIPNATKREQRGSQRRRYQRCFTMLGAPA